MSVIGILSTLFQIPDFLAASCNAQKFKQEFQQLGQALQSGNLSNAQSTYASLQQDSAKFGAALSSTSSSSSAPSSNGLNVSA